MSKFRNVVLTATLLAVTGFASAQSTTYPGVGRTATVKEVAAWDIDVRPDFKGLPTGSGSVAQGQDLWEAKCAHCHGVFGESNEVFSPLIGGTTKEDIKTGNVANLKRSDFPGRTTIMKVATVSTLWDYINRAMPWTAPKSLKPDEVYAVTAYLLSLADVVPENWHDNQPCDVGRQRVQRYIQARHCQRGMHERLYSRGQSCFHIAGLRTQCPRQFG
jgi:S-disulfanyl-L-cysteine oxidoreductase SoxD